MIVHTLNPSRLWKGAHGATATAWSDTEENVKAAKLAHAKQADSLLRVWVGGPVKSTESRIARTMRYCVLTYLGIRANIASYPAAAARRGPKKKIDR